MMQPGVILVELDSRFGVRSWLKQILWLKDRSQSFLLGQPGNGIRGLSCLLFVGNCLVSLN